MNHKNKTKRNEYMRNYYNKKKQNPIWKFNFQQRTNEWKRNHKQIIKESSRKYYLKNKTRMLKVRAEWRKNNQEKIIENRIKKATQIREAKAEYHRKNRDKIIKKVAQWQHENPDKVKSYKRKYKMNNPRSSTTYSLELQLSMNNVRKRDNNTCQWQNCGLTHRQAPIHVHHIFPRAEYPELELIEQYMICYCANHHGLWHRIRGDSYADLLQSNVKEGDLDLLLAGID